MAAAGENHSPSSSSPLSSCTFVLLVVLVVLVVFRGKYGTGTKPSGYPAEDLSIGKVERKQTSQRVQRDFAEALKNGRSKGGDRKKQISIDENSIVSRILGEVGTNTNTHSAKLQSPKVVRLEEIVKESKESRREKTVSVCSDNIPDLCPIGDDDHDVDETTEKRQPTRRHTAKLLQ